MVPANILDHSHQCCVQPLTCSCFWWKSSNNLRKPAHHEKLVSNKLARSPPGLKRNWAQFSPETFMWQSPLHMKLWGLKNDSKTNSITDPLACTFRASNSQNIQSEDKISPSYIKYTKFGKKKKPQQKNQKTADSEGSGGLIFHF